MEKQQSVGLIESVKDRIVHAIEGTGDVTGAMVNTISKTVAKTIEGLGGIATSLVRSSADVIQGTIQAVMDVGGDVGAAAKGTAVGELRGARQAGAATLQTISQTGETGKESDKQPNETTRASPATMRRCSS